MATIKKYTLKNGQERWHLKAYLGMDDVTGEEVRINKKGFITRNEAKKYLADEEYKFQNNLSERVLTYTFEDIYNDWMVLYEKTVASSTLNKTLSYFDLHILPQVDHIKIDKLKPGHMQKLVDHLHTSFIDYKKIFNYAKRVYQYAVDFYGLNIQSPFRAIIYPPERKSAKRKIQFLEVEELNDLLTALKDYGHPLWYTYFYLLAFTGMRRGEGLALKWDDIDWKNGTVTINKNITVGKNNKEYLKLSPKTDSSNRTIELDTNTLLVLKEWNNAKIRPISKENFIFPNSKGSWIVLSDPLQHLNRVCKKYNLKKITVHTLRHTHCSLLFESGWSVKSVQDRLGHEDINTTMQIYTHLTDRTKKENMNNFAEYIERISG